MPWQLNTKNWQNAKKEKLRTNNRERVSKWVGKGKEERRRQNLVLCLLLQKFSLSLPVSFQSTTPWSSRAEHKIPCRKKIILYSSYGDYRSTQGSYNGSIFQIDLLASLKQFVTFTLLFNDFGIRKKEFIATGLASLPACLPPPPHLSALCKYDEYFNKTVDLHQPAPLNFMCRFRRHVVIKQ